MLTHALVLFERLLKLPRKQKPSADELRGCIVLAMQLTVHEELGLDIEFVRALAIETSLHEVQAIVMESLGYRICVFEREFAVYRDAIAGIRL